VAGEMHSFDEVFHRPPARNVLVRAGERQISDGKLSSLQMKPQMRKAAPLHKWHVQRHDDQQRWKASMGSALAQHKRQVPIPGNCFPSGGLARHACMRDACRPVTADSCITHLWAAAGCFPFSRARPPVVAVASRVERQHQHTSAIQPY